MLVEAIIQGVVTVIGAGGISSLLIWSFKKKLDAIEIGKENITNMTKDIEYIHEDIIRLGKEIELLEKQLNSIDKSFMRVESKVVDAIIPKVEQNSKAIEKLASLSTDIHLLRESYVKHEAILNNIIMLLTEARNHNGA